jgi:hypothetical protein
MGHAAHAPLTAHTLDPPLLAHHAHHAHAMYVPPVAWSLPISGWVLHHVVPFQLDSVSALEGYDHCYYQFHAKDDATVPFSLGAKLWDSMTDVPEVRALPLLPMVRGVLAAPLVHTAVNGHLARQR